MNNGPNTPDDSGKTLMFDPAQTEAFRKAARLARQQNDPASADSSAAQQAVQAPAEAQPETANRTMMFGAEDVARLRGSAMPPSAVVASREATGVQEVESTRTMAFAPGDAAKFRGMTAETGMTVPVGNIGGKIDSPESYAKTQIYMPKVDPNQTMAYTPEQAKAALGLGGEDNQTVVYSPGQKSELQDAFQLLKRQQAAQVEADAKARQEAEALLRGIGDVGGGGTQPRLEAVKAPVVDAMTQPRFDTTPLHSQPVQTSPGLPPLQSQPVGQLPLTPSASSSHTTHKPLPDTTARPPVNRFETGQPQKSDAGAVVFIVVAVLVLLGAATVALNYFNIVDLGLDFLPKQ